MTGNFWFISERFLTTLFDIVEKKKPYQLRVTRPENNETFNMAEAIVTYSPEHNKVVMHFGLKTLAIHMTDWVELHSDRPGHLAFVKADIILDFVDLTVPRPLMVKR